MTRQPARNLHTLALSGMIAVTLVALVLRPLATRYQAPTPVEAAVVASTGESPRASQTIQLCQALGPAAPYPIWAVDSAKGGCQYEVGWDARGCAPWQSFAQGEYVGNARTAHVPEYRLRVDDTMSVFYLRTRDVQPGSYHLQVGDRIRVESLTAGNSTTSGDGSSTATDDSLNRELVVQPDGTIKLPLVNRVPAAPSRRCRTTWKRSSSSSTACRPSPSRRCR